MILSYINSCAIQYELCQSTHHHTLLQAHNTRLITVTIFQNKPVKYCDSCRKYNQRSEFQYQFFIPPNMKNMYTIPKSNIGIDDASIPNNHLSNHVAFHNTVDSTNMPHVETYVKDINEYLKSLQDKSTLYVCCSCGEIVNKLHTISHIYSDKSPFLQPLHKQLYIIPPNTPDKLRLCKFCYNKLKCSKCPLYCKANKFDFGSIPPELLLLRPVEKRMISKFIPRILIHKVRGGNFMSTGHAVSFQHSLGIKQVQFILFTCHFKNMCTI